MVCVTFELWDGELGVQLGSYGSEAEALEAVRQLLDETYGSPAPLGLTAGDLGVIASGQELVRLAREA